MTVAARWFDVDKEGLAKVLERRGKEFIVFELISNCLDTAAKVVAVSLAKVAAGRAAIVIEDDDPDGFQDLAHAYTLFAESTRKGDQSKRGRFNFGEKIVLAGCADARIETTTGTVTFDRTGRHVSKRGARASGSVFAATLRMNKEEFEAACKAALRILPPPGVTITFNGAEIPHRVPVATIPRVTLLTVIPDEEGFLKKTYRSTELHVYEPLPGEVAMLYELGIPVVETSDRWHVDVRQKIPVNLDRDNVEPSYLRDVRVAVVNALAQVLSQEDAAKPLASEALSDRDVTAEATSRILDLRYGEKRAIYDPSDKEANNRLVAEGYTLIHGGQLSGEQWENVRRHGAAKPAGQLRPTAKARFSADGTDYWIKDEDLSYGMKRIAKYVRVVAPALIDQEVHAGFIDAPESAAPWEASFGDGGLVFNVRALGRAWFDKYPTDPAVNELLIHELAHAVEGNHLSDKYHEACCRIGAKLAKLYLDKPMTVLS